MTRANVLVGNVFHDGPRSGINFNDGAMGGEVMNGGTYCCAVPSCYPHTPV